MSTLSTITDPAQERKQMALVTLAALSGAAAYICMVFIAMPISVHLIVNVNDLGCDPTVPSEQCFAPTSDSQAQYTIILLLLRLSTFLSGSVIGVCSDRFGRKPLLIAALTGYGLTGIFFLIGWETQALPLYFLGAILLGLSSPINPHCYAYATDISPPNRLAHNMGTIQGFGYFIGLMSGALISVVIASQTTGKDEDGVKGLEPYETLFMASYLVGSALALVSGVIIAMFLPESLVKEMRSESIDLRKGNPFSFIVMVTKNKYIFWIWVSAFIGWIAVGATEAVTGGWWLRRYAIPNITIFIYYIVAVWAASALGSALLTGLYAKKIGVKRSIHMCIFLTIAVALTLALAPNSDVSYLVVPLSFFSVSVYPLTLAVLFGQVDENERGALAGALRASEALAKTIGIAAFGAAFTLYLTAYTPPQSCVPEGYSSTNAANTCDCGVNTCPTLTATGFLFEPSECSTGLLSMALEGKASTNVPFPYVDGTLVPVPQSYVDLGLLTRSDQCRGQGLVKNVKGFETEIPRNWCASVAVSTVNAELGCVDFDLSLLAIEGNTYQCAIAAPNCTVIGSTSNCCNDLIPKTGNLSALVNDLELGSQIFANISAQEQDACAVQGPGDLNVCLVGPVDAFPGLIPFLYGVGLAILSWAAFCVAEFMYVDQDKEGWKDTGDEVKAAM